MTRAPYTLVLGLLITGCVCGSDLTVWQTPPIINATEGQQVNITCHFTVESGWEHLIVQWLKDNIKLPQHVYTISAVKSNNSDINHTSVLHLPSARLNDSGVYNCTVDQTIPRLIQAKSRLVTELRVEATNDTTVPTPAPAPAPSKPSAVLVIGGSVVSSVLVTVLLSSVVYCACRGRRTRPKPHRQDQSEQVTESSSVLYAALNIRKPQNRTDPAEISPQTDAACPTDSGVLYSDVRLKVPKQKHTPLSDQT